MLDVFAGTYSESVQDSLYRMGMAALAAVACLSLPGGRDQIPVATSEKAVAAAD